MSETEIGTTVAPDEMKTAAKRMRRDPGTLNSQQVNALALAEQIADAAKKTTYAPALAARGIDAAFVTQLLADIKACRDTSAGAIRGTTGASEAAQATRTTRDALVAAIQEVQAAASQKHASTDPIALRDYFIGERLAASHAALSQYVEAILQKLATDPLPGITPARIEALVDLRDAWDAARAARTGNQSDATAARALRDEQLHTIMTRRRTIQYAADAQWPYTDRMSVSVRPEFALPAGRPFRG